MFEPLLIEETMRNNSDLKGVLLGFFLLIGLNIIAGYVLFALIFLISAVSESIHSPLLNFLISDYRYLVLLAVPGLTQLIYVIPLVLWLKKRERWGLMKGVIIGAVITALLNGGCWLFLIR